MITIITYVDSDGKYKGFSADGHAEYADPGEDIVCAAVSVLTTNTINAIETFTDDEISYETDDGYLKFEISGKISQESQLLLNAMMLGLQSIEKSYGTDDEGNQFISIQTEEV